MQTGDLLNSFHTKMLRQALSFSFLNEVFKTQIAKKDKVTAKIQNDFYIFIIPTQKEVIVKQRQARSWCKRK